MASAADVPGKFDVIIDGQGYVFDDSIDPSSVYSSRQRAQFGLSPIFVQRQNVSGNYGDNQQDFFLTFTQRDWSLGEQQRYARPNDNDSARRYWQGTKIDVRTIGQARLRRQIASLTFAAAVSRVCMRGTPGDESIAAVSATTLYWVDNTATITSKGAHGLGVTPTAMVSDTNNLYISGEGGVGVRRYDGASFTTFSATTADALAFLNNTLFGCQNGGNNLVRYDSAGASTTLFTWKTATGTAASQPVTVRLLGVGGKLFILRQLGYEGSELWIYDGSGTSMIAKFPKNFIGWAMEEVNGIVFVSGCFVRKNGTSNDHRPAIYYYASGTTGLLWQANSYFTPSGSATILGHPALAPYDNGLLFTDDTTGSFMFYDPIVGGVQTIGGYTVSGDNPLAAATSTYAVHIRNQTAAYFTPDRSTIAASGSISHSLIDLDSSLTKNFHGVRVEFDAASDGDGGSVDVAYRVGDVDGAYTSLATGVTSGSEILFSGVSGKAISIKVTLNKGTSTNGPVLKRVSVRASPIQPQYALARYQLALYGTDRSPEPTRVKLRDDSYHTKSGIQMLADLRTSTAKTAPIVVTDEWRGTFNAVIVPDDLAVDRIHVGEYRVQISLREV